MEFKAIQFVNAHISQDHDHDVCFHAGKMIDDKFVSSRLDKLGSAPIYYVGYTGDPVVNYTFGSLNTTEAKRLKNLIDNSNVENVTTSTGNIILNTNFDNNPVNTLIEYQSDWISADVNYKITTANTECRIGRYEIDSQTSNVVSVKYCILDEGSVSLNTENKYALATHGNVAVNSPTSSEQIIHYIQGPITLSSSSKGYVFVVEYTD